MSEKAYVIRLSCKDQPGIVAAITTALASLGANILESNQFWDRQADHFFLRIAVTVPADVTRDAVERTVQPAIDRFALDLKVTDVDQRPRIIIMVSKFDHAMHHLLYQINTGDQLCHRVFDLKPRVHFKEIEIAIAVHDEFHGSRRGVANRLSQRAGLLPHRAPRCFIQKRRRCLFDDLLVAPLDRTFPFVQINAVAVLVGQHLNFDVAGLRDKFLDEYPVVTETRRSLVL